MAPKEKEDWEYTFQLTYFTVILSFDMNLAGSYLERSYVPTLDIADVAIVLV